METIENGAKCAINGDWVSEYVMERIKKRNKAKKNEKTKKRKEI